MTNRSLPHTITHTTNHSHNQLLTQPITHTINHSHNQSLTQPITHSTNHSHNQSLTQPITHTTNSSNNLDHDHEPRKDIDLSYILEPRGARAEQVKQTPFFGLTSDK